MRTLIIMTWLAGGAASAGTLRGERAETLTYALVYAGTMPTSTRGELTFSQAEIDCVQTIYPGTGMSDYRCQVDGIELADATAYMLSTSLTAAGVAMTIDSKGTEHRIGRSVSCTLYPSRNVADRYVCTADTRRIKELIQTVKLEKQH